MTMSASKGSLIWASKSSCAFFAIQMAKVDRLYRSDSYIYNNENITIRLFRELGEMEEKIADLPSEMFQNFVLW